MDYRFLIVIKNTLFMNFNGFQAILLTNSINFWLFDYSIQEYSNSQIFTT